MSKELSLLVNGDYDKTLQYMIVEDPKYLDNYTCLMCGEYNIDVDHISIPILVIFDEVYNTGNQTNIPNNHITFNMNFTKLKSVINVLEHDDEVIESGLFLAIQKDFYRKIVKKFNPFE